MAILFPKKLDKSLIKAVFLVFLITQFSFWGNTRSIEEIDRIIYKSQFKLSTLKMLKKHEQKLYRDSPTKQTLLNLKYINYFLLLRNQNNFEKYLKLNLELRNESKNSNDLLYLLSTNQLANNLRLANPKKSQELFNIVKKLNKQTKYDPIENDLNSDIASNSYNKGNYKKAIKYWKLCFIYFQKHKIRIKAASMINNIALSYSAIGEKQIAINKSKIGLKILENPINSDEMFLKMLLTYNMGGYYLDQKEFEVGIKFSYPLYEFCFKNPKFLKEIPSVAERLIFINKQKNDINSIELILNDLKRTIYQVSKPEEKYMFCKIIYNYYLFQKDIPNINKYGEMLVRFQDDKLDDFRKRSSFINEQLTNSTISSLEESFQAEAKYEKQKSLAAYSIIALFILSSSVYFYQKRKTDQKEAIILDKDEQIEMIEYDLLQTQQKQQQEKMLALQMNINLKNATAQAFADKLKQLKRKKDIDTEDVIKELQVQINNLLSIDKKNTILTEDTETEKKKFNDMLRKLHPDLTNQELQLCSHYRMYLSAKEIATIEGITPGSARVYKNKIKNKLGLKPDDNLNLYLKELSI